MRQRFGLLEDSWLVHRFDKVCIHSKSYPSHRVRAYSALATNQTTPLTAFTSIQDTTGALLLSRSHLQARQFPVQFEESQVKQTYLALVQGGKEVFPDTSGSIRNVLMYDSNGWFNKIVHVKYDVAEGMSRRRGEEAGPTRKIREAITPWELLRSSVCSLHLRSCPHT